MDNINNIPNETNITNDVNSFYDIFSSLIFDISSNSIVSNIPEVDMSSNIVDMSSNIVDMSSNIVDISNNTFDVFGRYERYRSYSRIMRLINRINNELPNINVLPHSNNSSNLNQVLLNTLDQKNKYKNVLSTEGESQIKYLKYCETDKTIKKCPILHVPFDDETIVAQLPCNHIFDKESILQWLKEESNKCPVCRHELCSKEKKIEYIPEFNNVVLPNESNETNETHPYGAENRSQGFYNFLNEMYERREQDMIQRAIEQSLLDLTEENKETEETEEKEENIFTDSEEDIPLFYQDY